MRSDLIAGVGTFVLGAVIAVEARRIPDGGTDGIGPGTFPFALGVIIALCGAALLLGALKAPPAEAGHDSVRWPVVWTAFALLVAYAFALAYLGFLLATILLVPALLVLLGPRDIRRVSLSAVAVSGAVFVIFGKLLGVDLPVGRRLRRLTWSSPTLCPTASSGRSRRTRSSPSSSVSRGASSPAPCRASRPPSAWPGAAVHVGLRRRHRPHDARRRLCRRRIWRLDPGHPDPRSR